jgi:hypothetical protein
MAWEYIKHHAAKADISAPNELKGQAAKEPDDSFANAPDDRRVFGRVVHRHLLRTRLRAGGRGTGRWSSRRIDGAWINRSGRKARVVEDARLNAIFRVHPLSGIGHHVLANLHRHLAFGAPIRMARA